MNCKKEGIVLPKTFINGEFKKKRQALLFQNETLLFRETQRYIEYQIKKEQYQQKMQNLKNQLREIKKEYETYIFEFETTNQTAFAFGKCPKEGCYGYLEETVQTKTVCCGICKEYYCKECLESVNSDVDTIHTCNNETINTIQIIKQDSKPCPKCGIFIHKLIGCDQMFCTNCTTAFDWKTGNVNIGTVHNPHYFEYLGTQNREPGAILCGREIDNNFIERLINLFKEFKQENEVKKLFILRCGHLAHLLHIDIPRLLYVRSNRDLRIDFMRQFISEDIFKKEIEKRYRETKRNREAAEILGTFVGTCTEIYYRFVVEKGSFTEFTSEVNALFFYINECLRPVKYHLDTLFHFH
jgi:hypothetical protein